MITFSLERHKIKLVGLKMDQLEANEGGKALSFVDGDLTLPLEAVPL